MTITPTTQDRSAPSLIGCPRLNLTRTSVEVSGFFPVRDKDDKRTIAEVEVTATYRVVTDHGDRTTPPQTDVYLDESESVIETLSYIPAEVTRTALREMVDLTVSDALFALKSKAAEEARNV